MTLKTERVFFFHIFKAELNNNSILNSIPFHLVLPEVEGGLHVSCLHLHFFFELFGMLDPLRSNVFIQEAQSK